MTEIRYAEIFAYNSTKTDKGKNICISPDVKLLDDMEKSLESIKNDDVPSISKDKTKKYIMSYDDTLNILDKKYGITDYRRQKSNNIELAMCQENGTWGLL